MPGDSEQIHVPAAVAGAAAVVTSVPVKSGETIREGTVLVVVAGRPVIGLALPFQLYRDLYGGMTGPDVGEVQRALRRLGYGVTVNSKFDASTQAAIGRLYRDRGFDPPPGLAEAVAGLPGAHAAVEQAQADLDAAIAAGEGVETATAALNSAKETLATLELESGPSLTQSNVTRLTATGTVTAVKVSVGDVLANPESVLFEINGGQPYVLAGASRDQAAVIVTGQAATIVDEETGRTATATVSSVGTEPASDPNVGVTGFPIRLAFSGEPLPAVNDRSVRIDIAASSDAAPVLAVPVTAVYSRADGTTFVTVMRADGTTVDLTVTAGRVAGGWIEIIDAGDLPLAPGDLVVVGVGDQG
jgi:peptidoglycan hydrolase-like protein with peptidoglycan-binding domain